MYYKKSQAGFSLIQVVFVATILTFLGAGLSKLIINQIDQTAYTEDLLEKQEFRREAALLLDDPTACKETLKGLKIENKKIKTEVSSIKNFAGEILYKKDDLYKNTQIENIYVKNRSVVKDSTGIIDFYIGLKRTKKKNVSFKPFSVPVIVNLDSNSKVKSCGDLEKFATIAIAVTPNGLGIIPTGRRIRLDNPSDGKVNSSGDISLEKYGIRIQEDGCYQVLMHASLLVSPHPPVTPNSVNHKFVISFFRKNKKGLQKFGHMNASGQAMVMMRRYVGSKNRVSPQKKRGLYWSRNGEK